MTRHRSHCATLSGLFWLGRVGTHVAKGRAYHVSALLVGHSRYCDHSVSALVTSRLSTVWPSAADPPLMTGPSPRQPRSPSNSSDASRRRTLRTLPIRVSPRTGEALDSYLEALAERSGTPWGDFLDAVGVGRPLGRPSTYPWLDRAIQGSRRLGQHRLRNRHDDTQRDDVRRPPGFAATDRRHRRASHTLPCPLTLLPFVSRVRPTLAIMVAATVGIRVSDAPVSASGCVW